MVAGLSFKTTDNTKWGAGNGLGTGGNLTPQQADEDIWVLHSRIQVLEDNPPTARSIESFTVIGSQLQVNMSDGSTEGPFDLPIATFQMKGDWVNDMTYYPLDVVSVPHDGLYVVNIQHTTPASPATFDPQADDGSGNLLYTKVFGDDAWIYDVGWFYPGQPGLGIEDDAPIAAHLFRRAVICPANLVDSGAELRVPPASDLSFDLQVNGVVKGSVDFASGETVGTFTFATQVSCAPGDIIQIMKPSAVDSAAKDLTVTLILTREFDA